MRPLDDCCAGQQGYVLTYLRKKVLHPCWCSWQPGAINSYLWGILANEGYHPARLLRPVPPILEGLLAKTGESRTNTGHEVGRISCQRYRNEWNNARTWVDLTSFTARCILQYVLIFQKNLKLTGVS